jgi:hypothetical protein
MLAGSHTSAVAVAVLLYWSLYWGFTALEIPVARAASFLFTSVAILNIPYGSFTFTGFSFKDALPDLSGFVVLFLVWYLLVRWLYFTPPKTGASEPARNPEPAS